MTAKVGEPLRFGLRLDGGAADYEIHLADGATELVVCGDCGFTWDADETVKDEQGREGYECPRCVLRLFVDARQKVIEDTVLAGAEELADRIVESCARIADAAERDVRLAGAARAVARAIAKNIRSTRRRS